jgi:hypothetical protein
MLVELDMSIIEIILCSPLQLEHTYIQNEHTIYSCIDFGSQFQLIQYINCNIVPF